MKKIWKGLLSVLACGMLACGAAACGDLGGLLGEEESSSKKTSSVESSSVKESSSEKVSSEESSSEKESSSESGVSSENSSIMETAEITFTTLTVEDSNVSGVFSNATTEFSFKDEIQTFGGAKYMVAANEYAENPYVTKIVPLREGDNVFYVFEMIDDEVEKTYVVTLRRRPTYTVSFDGNGVAPQTVEEDSVATEPTDIPTRVGYTFDKWDYDFATPISESITITAKWKINQYTLTVVYGNGQDDKIITQDYDTSIAQIENPTRSGYDFKAWDKEMPMRMPAENVTVTAQWDAIYTVNNGVITGLTDYGASNYTALEIPAAIDGETIVAIDNFAFYDCSSLTSIEIPDGVTSIGNSAFSDCDNLTNVTIGNGVTSIGDLAFYNCYNLTNIDIPDGVESIGYSAFYHCDNLTNVTIGNSVTSIGDSAFYNCYNLTAIELPDGVTTIGNYAFANCLSLTSIEIPNSVTSIGNSAFYGCDSLTSIEIPDSVTSIGKGAFYGCDSLTSIEIPDSVTSIGDYVFYYCDSLTSIEIPDSITSIGHRAFYGCSSLTSIVIPDSVTSIGDGAFYGCDRLTIYCEAESKPDGWSSSWKDLNCSVVWGV